MGSREEGLRSAEGESMRREAVGLRLAPAKKLRNMYQKRVGTFQKHDSVTGNLKNFRSFSKYYLLVIFPVKANYNV